MTSPDTAEDEVKREMIKVILQEFPKQGFTDIKTDSGEQMRLGKEEEYTPDVTFKRNDEHRTLVIMAVETCSALAEERTGRKWRVFHEEAKRVSGQFHLAVPRFCNGNSGRDVANRRLEELHLEADAIWAINGSLRYFAMRAKKQNGNR